MRRSVGVQTSLLAAALALPLGAESRSGEPEWQIIKPSNTGVPGESVRFAKFAPDGRMWVSARWPFWSEGGVGIYDFDTKTWATYANLDTPIPSEFVNDVEFAADGSTWMATDGGLVHWAGETWTVYTTANAPLLHNGIRDIDLDAEGHVWLNNSHVQATDAALFEFDGVEWRMFQVGAELPWALPWKQLSSVLVDHLGHVWVANTVLNGLAEHDGEDWVLHGADVNRMSRLREDHDGNLWMVAGTGGGNVFYRYDRSTFTAFHSGNTPFSNTTITTVAVGPDGRAWAGNWMGEVIVYDGARWTLFTDVGVRVHSIVPLASGEVWLTSAGAARHYDAAGNWLEAFNSYNTGLPDYFIEDFFSDSRGHTWFSTREAGVSYFDGTRWDNWGSHNPNHDWPFLADGAEGMGEDDHGSIWIGSNGVGRLDVAEEFLEIWDWRNSNLGVVWTNSTCQGPGGTMWMGTDYAGAYWFDGSDWRNQFFPPGGSANQIKDIITDRTGDLWILTQVELHRYDGAAWTKWGSSNSPLAFGSVGALASHPDGSLWIATRAGVARFDGTSWTIYDETNADLPANIIHDVAIRDDGLVAVAANDAGTWPYVGGVAIFDGTTWTSWTTENSPLTHFQVIAVGFDAEGHLWASPLSEGVVKILLGFDPADVNRDGTIDFEDLLLLLAAWGECDGCVEDIDGDGVVGFSDVLIVLASWS